MLFDSHAHYDDESFDLDRDEILSSLREQNVGYVVNAGADIESSIAGIKLSEKYDFIYSAVGVHPHSVEDLVDLDLDRIEKLSKTQKVVAIGEIGLDYYYEHSPREIQRIWFKKQMDLAKKLDMPIIVHSRDAAKETYDMIKESGLKKGVIHCYSGSSQMAKDYIKLGFYIGIGGTVTFKNARKTVEVVSDIPLDSILLETDCPYLTPVPHRGKRNNSKYLSYIAQKVADIKKIPIEEVVSVTTKNSKKLYNI